MTGQNLIALVQTGQVVLQHVFEQNEDVLTGLGGQRNKTRHHMTRNVDHGQGGQRQMRLAQRPQPGDQVQGPIGQVRKRVTGVNGQRGENRIEGLAKKILKEAFLFGVQVRGGDKVDAGLGQLGVDRIQETPVLLINQFVNPSRDGRQRLSGHQPVRADPKVALADLSLDAGDPDHEEFVEV